MSLDDLTDEQLALIGSKPQLDAEKIQNCTDEDIRTIASAVMLDVQTVGVSKKELETVDPVLYQDVCTLENEISRRPAFQAAAQTAIEPVKEPLYLVVLNDGESFTNITGCRIVICPPGMYDQELHREDLKKLPYYDIEDVLLSFQACRPPNERPQFDDVFLQQDIEEDALNDTVPLTDEDFGEE